MIVIQSYYNRFITIYLIFSAAGMFYLYLGRSVPCTCIRLTLIQAAHFDLSFADEILSLLDLVGSTRTCNKARRLVAALVGVAQWNLVVFVQYLIINQLITVD